MSRSANPPRKRTAKGKSDYQRVEKGRNLNKRILLVCEGEKTEPRYLSALISHLGLTSTDVEICENCGSAPINVVDGGLKKLTRDSDFDAVYFIFDKDQHESYSRALDKIQGASISRKYSGKSLKAICSVPCFELWFLIHYRYTTTPFITSGDRSSCGNLIATLKSLPQFQNYEKGRSSMFVDLLDNMPDALRNANRLMEAAKTSSTDNPTTMIHILIDDLTEVKKKAEEEAKKSKEKLKN